MNIKQSELAEQLGVSKATISMWETDKRSPTIDTLKKLSKIFGCTTDELLEPIETDFEGLIGGFAMTKQEYEKQMEDNFKRTAVIAGQVAKGAFGVLSDAMTLKLLNDLKIDELSIEIAYLKSRVEALEKLVGSQTKAAETVDEQKNEVETNVTVV